MWLLGYTTPMFKKVLHLVLQFSDAALKFSLILPLQFFFKQSLVDN